MDEGEHQYLEEYPDILPPNMPLGIRIILNLRLLKTTNAGKTLLSLLTA